jgi:hypothetical protein
VVAFEVHLVFGVVDGALRKQAFLKSPSSGTSAFSLVPIDTRMDKPLELSGSFASGSNTLPKVPIFDFCRDEKRDPGIHSLKTWRYAGGLPSLLSTNAIVTLSGPGTCNAVWYPRDNDADEIYGVLSRLGKHPV